MKTKRKSFITKRRALFAGLALLGIAVVAGGTTSALYFLLPVRHVTTASQKVTTSPQAPQSAAPAPSSSGVTLDPSKNYGDKYADGILPVGDGHYSTSEAKVGYPYVCDQYAHNLITSQGGAQGQNEPWFNADKTTYDSTKKLHVQGSVGWHSTYTMHEADGMRTITTNGLPAHLTGVFPIAASDPAYAYDRNPNAIQSHTVTYALTDSPSYGDPHCIDGEVGIMNSAVPLFSAFDAGGRDAGAWEVQDECSGHPQKDGVYHYHTLSSCIGDVSVTSVIGYAFDGYPITGPKVGSDNILTTDDLDVCHGLTSAVNEDGTMVTTYHYVMTQDFPYSISCFRSTPIQTPQLQ